VFRSIADLQTAINRYLKEHNDDPKPFIWTKPVDVILAKLDRLPVPSVEVSALEAGRLRVSDRPITCVG
jgi:hypothetical protein